MVRLGYKLGVALLISILAVFPSSVRSQEVKKGEVVVSKRNGASRVVSLSSIRLPLNSAVSRKLNSNLAVVKLGSGPLGGAETEELNESYLTKCAEIMALNRDVICEPNYKYSIGATSNDTYYDQLYGLSKIGAETAWNTTTGSSSVKVAVIDTGIKYDHPDLQANIAVNSGETPNNGTDDDGNGYVDDYYGYNFYGDNGDPNDDNDHGTHCAGTIGGVGNNARGVVGVNWSVGLIAVKVLSAEGSGYMSDIAAGIDYARVRGAFVMNLSLGGPSGATTLLQALERARDAGIVVAAAAGNESSNNDTTPAYPASYNLSNMLSVAATDSNDNLASFSNYGASTVHLGAPGVSILSTVSWGGYESFSGTSMATPHVAGAAALIKASNSGLSASEVRSKILSNLDSLSSLSGKTTTGGRLNVAKAISGSGGGTPPPDDGGGDGSDPGGSDPGGSCDSVIVDLARVSQNNKAVVVEVFVGLASGEEYVGGAYSIEISGSNGKTVARKSTDEDGFASAKIGKRKKPVRYSVTATVGSSVCESNVLKVGKRRL